MISVYTAESMVDAQLVCDALITEGLEASINGGYLSGAIGELPAGQLISVWIVDTAMEAKARGIVANFEATYVAGKERGGEAQTCRQCGERLESQFSHCWQCGQSLVS